MKITILTLFPSSFSPLEDSIIKRAVESDLLELNIIDVREYSNNKWNKLDDYPFGGGAGMVLQVEPWDIILNKIKNNESYVIATTPSGKIFNQSKAIELSSNKELIFLCGRYEGFDQRIIDLHVDEELTIGDYVLTNGDIAATVMIDSIVRLIDGVLGNSESTKNESFSDGLLEHPQYTRPAEYNGLEVPEVLMSGHHKNIERWQKEQSIIKTYKNRQDLFDRKSFTKEDEDIIKTLKENGKL